MIKGVAVVAISLISFWAVVAGLLSIFLIGFNVEPARYSFLDNAVEGASYFLYFIIYRFFVAREEAYFLVLVEVNQAIWAHDD